MSTVINIHSDELDEHFIQAIKEMFRHKKLEIAIQEVEYQDETEYLFSTEANKKHLLEAMERVERREGLIEVDLEELKRKANEND